MKGKWVSAAGNPVRHLSERHPKTLTDRGMQADTPCTTKSSRDDDWHGTYRAGHRDRQRYLRKDHKGARKNKKYVRQILGFVDPPRPLYELAADLYYTINTTPPYFVRFSMIPSATDAHILYECP